MNIVSILMSCFIFYDQVKSDQKFVLDYFTYKNVTSVVGINCYDNSENIILTKNFNEKKIMTSNYKLNSQLKIQLIAKTKYWKIGVFFDTRCYTVDDVASLLNRATEYKLFDELRTWLILGYDLEDVLRVVNDEAFGMSTEFVIATSTDSSRYEMYDVYNILKKRGGLLNLTYFGNWKSDTGLNISLTQSKFHRRSNLHRLVIKAMFYKSNFKPYDMPLEEYYEDYEHATRDSQSKFAYHVLSHLSDIYNFSLQARESSAWEKGDRLGPITRAIKNHEIDITGTPVSIIPVRLQIMKYIHQDWPLKTCFIFRNPQPTSIKVDEIWRPLKDEVWYLMGFFMLTSVPVLLVALRHDDIEMNTKMISNSFLIVLGALCQQSTDLQMKKYSTRIAFLSVMIFSFLIFNYYSASIVSVRLGEPIIKINDSLLQLGALQLKMASEDMVYFEFFLKKPDWETLKFYEKYWKKIPESEQYLEPDVAMRLVKKGGFAYHTHAEIAYYYIDQFFDHREICELTEVHLGGPLLTAFGVDYNSTITDIGRVGMIRIAEVGLSFRQIHRWQYRKPLCRKEILTIASITIYEFAPHLFLLLIGASLSAVVFGFEILISHRYHLIFYSKANLIIKSLLPQVQIQIRDSDCNPRDEDSK